jgi:hypothetical protein
MVGVNAEQKRSNWILSVASDDADSRISLVSIDR